MDKGAPLSVHPYLCFSFLLHAPTTQNLISGLHPTHPPTRRLISGINTPCLPTHPCTRPNAPLQPEEVLLDEDALAANASSFQLVGPAVSPDGALLAYGVDRSGAEIYTL